MTETDPSLVQWGYVHTQRQNIMSYHTLPEAVYHYALLHPDKEAYVERHLDGSRRTLSFSQLYKRANSVAKYLVGNLHLQPGAYVAMAANSSLEWVIADLAVVMAGGVAVHFAVDSTVDLTSVDTLLQHIQCSMAFVDVNDTKELQVLCKHLQKMENKSCNVSCGCSGNCTDEGKSVTSCHLDTLKCIVFLTPSKILNGHMTLNEMEKNSQADISLPCLTPEDTAFVLTTSGSTGLPKLVPQTHFSITNRADLPVFSTRQANPSVFYNDRPFGWNGGFPLLYAVTGATLVFLRTSEAVHNQSIESVWACMEAEKVTSGIFMLYMINKLLRSQIDTISQYKPSCIITGGALVDERHSELVGRYCDVFIVTYGSTEAGNVSRKCITRRTKSEYLRGNVGQPIAGMEVKVVDARGKTLKRNEVGDIWTRGLIVFPAYLGQPDLTQEVKTEDGWFKTKDIGLISSDGDVIVQGRDNDFVKRGTQKIFLFDIQEQLVRMPKVKEMIIVPVPDKEMIEEMCVCYVAEETVNNDDVRSYCEGISLAGHNILTLDLMPKYFLRCQSFPLQKSGKVDRLKLVELAITEFQLNS